MNKKFFIGTLATIITIAAYILTGKHLTVNDNTNDMLTLNVEALAGGESDTPSCTGPYLSGWCHCIDGYACKDLLGCD